MDVPDKPLARPGVYRGGSRRVASRGGARVAITERAAQRIVAELEAAGYVSHERVGRRNRYQVNTDLHLRHSLEEHLEIGTLLNVLTKRD